MRIYISGPMTDYPELNFPAFHAAAAQLRAAGYEVVNPAELNPAGTSYGDCMRTDLTALLTCDVIAMLPGWSGSRGATHERATAEIVGMAIWEVGCWDRHIEAHLQEKTEAAA